MIRRPPRSTRMTHSFPTRRASDLLAALEQQAEAEIVDPRIVRDDGEILDAAAADLVDQRLGNARSEEHTSELQSLMRISYAVFCLKKKKTQITNTQMKSRLNNKQTDNI